MLCVAVGVCHEVADALELQVFARLALGCELFYIAVVIHMETFRVEQLAEVALVGRGILHVEEAVVFAHLSLYAGISAHPVESLSLIHI